MPRVKSALNQSPAFWFLAGSSAAVVYRKVPRPLILSFALGAGMAILCLERTGSAALTLVRAREKRAAGSEPAVVEEDTVEETWLTLPSWPTFSLSSWSSSPNPNEVQQLKADIQELRTLITQSRTTASPARPASTVWSDEEAQRDTVIV